MDLERLAQRLREEGFREDAYVLDSHGYDRFDSYGVLNAGETWEVFYVERGERSILQVCATEQEACSQLYELLLAGRGTRAHCVGFFSTQADADNLAGRLRDAGLTPTTNAIPWTATEKRYRVFVHGREAAEARRILGT